MDSQADSLDIAKLKRFALGLDETDVSQAFLSEPDSQSSSLTPQPLVTEQKSCGDAGEAAIHQIASHAVSSKSVLAVHVIPTPNHDVQPVSQSSTRLQEFLTDSSESIRAKMSSGDSGPGDTQPISQSIIENIMSRSKLHASSQDHSHVDIDMHDADQGTFQMTVKEGEPGHVDLLSGFGESNPNGVHHGSDSDALSSKDGQSSPSQFQNNICDYSQLFMKTPGTVGKLQDAPNLATATPSLPRNPLAADLGSSGGIMALSQVFKATQAPSSPFVNGLPSGPLSDRPSPNIPIQARPVETYTSSPFRTPRSNLHRTHTDPHTYVSMDESQKQRNKMNEGRRTRSVEDMNLEDQSDEDFDEEPSFVRRLKRRKRINQETDARLSAVGRASPRKLGNRPSTSWSQDIVSVMDGDTQQSTVEGTSEEETEQEDNVIAPTSQARQPLFSMEEDKENFIGPLVTASNTTSLAHDRLSQALDLHKSPSSFSALPNEKETSAPEHNITTTEQIINVRDSQPSPTQQKSKNDSDTHISSQHEFDRVSSSPIESSPPRKRVRRQHDSGQEDDVSPVRQSAHSHSHSVSSIQPVIRSPQHHSRPTSVPLSSSAQNVNAAEKSSSMPSLVANTPLNKMDNNTVPETTIPESSPNARLQQVTLSKSATELPHMQGLEQEDDDLPTPHHRRHWDNIITGQSPDKTPRALRNTISREEKLFTSSSPMAGRIKSLSQISAEHSPQQPPDDEIDFDILDAGDREFSKVVEALNHQTPTKRREVNGARTPLRSASSISTVSKIDFGKAVDHPFHHQDPDDSEIPEPTYTPTVTRRQRGRPSRRTGNIWEIEESPRKLDNEKSRKSENRSIEVKPSKIPDQMSTSENIQSSQSSLVTDNSVPIQIERQTRETSVDSTVAHPPATNAEPEDAASEVHTPQPEETVIAPNQVLALWNGRKRAYYPATFLGTCGNQRCVVKFLDSAPVEVALGSVKKLQLQIGDLVKVEWPNVPKVTHVVRGFSSKFQVEDLTKEDVYGYLPVTDIYGYSKLILAAKQRKGLPGGGQVEPEETIEVPIYSVYMDMILWKQLKGRAFTVDPKAELIPPITQTPTGGISTPVSPGSRLSRSHAVLQTGLFAGMIFAVSFGDQDAAKTRVTKLISGNGGRILRDGFEELFDFPSSVRHVTPSSPSAQVPSTEETVQFRLAAGCENIGFACLVTDKYSRRAKYMQALALNVPCLSGKWVEDCVRKNRILSWEHYLLPAGESMYLNGAIKSRILMPALAEQSRFSETIDGRPKLLEGQSVLLVMGRGKAEEKRKAYLFLTYALGAARVERVLDLKAAKATLDEQTNDKSSHGWDWIYVDDHEEAAAKEIIMGKSHGILNLSKKRKRSSLIVQFTSDKTEKYGKQVRVMSNNFVCQSLILGKIYEEP